MRIALSFGVALVACASTSRQALEPLGAAPSVQGRVTLVGELPQPERWQLDEVMATACGAAEYVDETWSVDDSGGVQNCVIRLYPVEHEVEPPEPLVEGAVFDKVGPRYVPRVLVVPSGTRVTLRNEASPCSGFMTYSRSQQFNMMITAGNESDVVIEGRRPLLVHCAVREYARGAIVPVDTPYWAITGADGRFVVPEVPPGRYQVHLWHEGCGQVTDAGPQELAVGAESGTALDFSLKMGE